MTDTEQPGPGKARGPDLPTLLLVGSGEPMDVALREALERHGMFVDLAPAESIVDAVFAAAPDLVFLVGDAAADAGATVMARLASTPATAVVPIALLASEGALDQRIRAFRNGAVAVIQRSPSVDAIARQIGDLVREVPDRLAGGAGALGEATLDELMQLVSKELRSGILSVESRSDTSESAALRLVLGPGKPVAEAVEAFVHRLRALVAEAEPLRYEFQGSTVGRLQLLGPDEGGSDEDLSVFKDLRILIALGDPIRALNLERELRSRGAVVALTDGRPKTLETARGLDPAVAIVDASGVEDPAIDIVTTLRRDPRLRWSSVVVINPDEVLPDPSGSPELRTLARRISPLVAHERGLGERALKEARFDTRLEVTGPFRMLRALAGVESTLHVSVRNPRLSADLDLAGGLIVGIVAQRPGTDGERLEGIPALAELLSLPSGRLGIERRQVSATANLVTPLEQALAAASATLPGVVPAPAARAPAPASRPTATSPASPTSPSTPRGALPTTGPTARPSTSPTARPSTSPAARPSTSPAARPSTSPAARPSTSPAARPSTSPRPMPGPAALAALARAALDAQAPAVVAPPTEEGETQHDTIPALAEFRPPEKKQSAPAARVAASRDLDEGWDAEPTSRRSAISDALPLQARADAEATPKAALAPAPGAPPAPAEPTVQVDPVLLGTLAPDAAPPTAPSTPKVKAAAREVPVPMPLPPPVVEVRPGMRSAKATIIGQLVAPPLIASTDAGKGGGNAGTGVGAAKAADAMKAADAVTAADAVMGEDAATGEDAVTSPIVRPPIATIIAAPPMPTAPTAPPMPATLAAPSMPATAAPPPLSSSSTPAAPPPISPPPLVLLFDPAATPLPIVAAATAPAAAIAPAATVPEDLVAPASRSEVEPSPTPPSEAPASLAALASLPPLPDPDAPAERPALGRRLAWAAGIVALGMGSLLLTRMIVAGLPADPGVVPQEVAAPSPATITAPPAAQGPPPAPVLAVPPTPAPVAPPLAVAPPLPSPAVEAPPATPPAEAPGVDVPAPEPTAEAAAPPAEPTAPEEGAEPVAPTPPAELPVPAAPPANTPDAAGDDTLALARNLVARAMSARQGGNLGEAEQLYMRALRAEPLFVPAAEGLARLHMGRRDARSALRWAERAVKLRPGAAPLRILLGDAQALAGNRGAAEQSWRQAARLRPGNKQAQQRLARH